MIPLTLRASCVDPHGSDRPRADKSTEYLLFTRSGNVAGLTIEHRVKHHGAHADTYSPLYRFDRDLPPRVTEVLIRNGSGLEHEDGARFVGFTGNHHWLLNNPGERIRIVDQSGTVIAVFDIPAHTCTPLPAAPRVVVGSAAAAAAFGEID